VSHFEHCFAEHCPAEAIPEAPRAPHRGDGGARAAAWLGPNRIPATAVSALFEEALPPPARMSLACASRSCQRLCEDGWHRCVSALWSKLESYSSCNFGDSGCECHRRLCRPTGSHVSTARKNATLLWSAFCRDEAVFYFKCVGIEATSFRLRTANRPVLLEVTVCDLMRHAGLGELEAPGQFVFIRPDGRPLSHEIAPVALYMWDLFDADLCIAARCLHMTLGMNIGGCSLMRTTAGQDMWSQCLSQSRLVLSDRRKGAAALKDGSMPVEKLRPHHMDTVVEMCPYFRVDPMNLGLWKGLCDDFYKQAKREDGMVFYGFFFKEDSGGVRIRMGFRDVSALLAHLHAIGVPMEVAMGISQLDRVEFHGPHDAFAELQEVDMKLGKKPIIGFVKEAQPLRRATQHSGHLGSDATVSVAFHYAAREKGCSCSRVLKLAAEGLRARAFREAGLEHHSFSFYRAGAVLQQGFTSAEVAIKHLVATASNHAQLLEKAVLTRCELIGPPSEIDKIMSFVAQVGQSSKAEHVYTVNILKEAITLTLDDRAIRRTYAGLDVRAATTCDEAEHSILAAGPVVETAEVPAPRGRGSSCWSWLGCG